MKHNMYNNSPNLKRFYEKSNEVHSKYSEFVYENGKIVTGKAPNRRKIDDFYKKCAKHNAFKKKKR